MDAVEARSLPENAYLPLAAGETYQPDRAGRRQRARGHLALGALGRSSSASSSPAASAYSGLKVGQVMEAAIPISILAIGLGRIYARRSTLLENVIITGIGGVSGSVVAGAVFTLPALYILKLDPHPWQTIFICLAGGTLGVLFLIPLRRYFVRETHGIFPYPEATAITEVLVTGEKGGSQAKLLLQATGIAARLRLLRHHLPGLEGVHRPALRPGGARPWPRRPRMTLSFDALGFILGLGYVMGLRSSMILCAGGVLSNLVLVPLIWFVGSHVPRGVVYPGPVPIAGHDANQIFRGYVRLHRRGRHRHRRHLRHHQVAAHRGRLLLHRASRPSGRRRARAGRADRPRRLDDDASWPAWWSRALAVGIFLGNLGITAIVAAGGPRADPALLLLLHLGGGQRHRHHRAQPGLRHDDAHHHHLLGGAARASASPAAPACSSSWPSPAWSAPRSRSPARRSPTSRSATGSARRRPCPGAGQVPRRDRRRDRGGPHHRAAGPAPTSSARRRPATPARCSPRRRPRS